jgi:site-specific DNA-methyltransferase (adenine-specific)
MVESKEINIKDFENKIINGDCIEEMKKLPDNSIDAIITDPPYGLEFMGKSWDSFSDNGDSELLHNIQNDGKDNVYKNKGFNVLPRYEPNKNNINFQQFTINWAREALRVLKPGGYLLSFGGTRTYHRMACGIEDAGFEIRDCIMWIYGSGFPKSLNIGKQIDKIQGNERDVIGVSSNEKDFRDVGKKVKEEIGIDKLSFGTIENAERKDLEITKGNSEWEGWGTALKPACEPIVVARKSLSEKNVTLNVLKWGTGGINIDESRIPCNPILDKSQNRTMIQKIDGFEKGWGMKPQGKVQVVDLKRGRFPANIILDEESGDMLDEQSGESLSKRNLMNEGWSNKQNVLNKNGTGDLDFKSERGFNDKGGASRFFYCAKASKSERNNGCEELEDKDGNIKSGYAGMNNETQTKKNNHPTVKPIKLMEYLIKLVSKEKSLILDPFMGSGTTGIACIKTNRNFIGIEKELEYIKIIETRLNNIKKQKKLI